MKNPEFFIKEFVIYSSLKIYSIFLVQLLFNISQRIAISIQTLSYRILMVLYIKRERLSVIYGCTSWTLTKQLEKKLDGNYTRMLRAILNKSWQQHPTKHQLYGHLPPITKTIQVKWTLLEEQRRAHKWCTPMDPHLWPSKSKMASSNIHTAAMWRYGI